MSTTPGSIARGFLFADLRGYSAFVERHGDHAGSELLRTYRDLVRASTADFEGAEIKTEGDSFYLVFDSPSAAVRCGLAILEAASRKTTPSGHAIDVGIGVHAGETVAMDEGYVGSVVNIAARVCAAARPGELLVTDAVRALTRSYLDVGFVPAGRRRLKGIDEPVALHRVVPGRQVPQAGGRVPQPSGRTVGLGAALVAVVAFGVIALAASPFGDPRTGSAASATETAASGAASPAASQASPSTAAVVPFPNPAETVLRGRINADVARHCERPDEEDIPVIAYGANEQGYSGPLAVEAGLACPLGSISEPDIAWYWVLVETWAADEFFFATAGARSVRAGDCVSDDRAYDTWEYLGHSGRVMCIAGSRDARLYWTYDDERMMGIAIRADGNVDVLYQWWMDHARNLGVPET